MTNTKINNQMKCLVSRVQNRTFLTNSEKQHLLKTLGLAEKYINQNYQKEQNITANTESLEPQNKVYIIDSTIEKQNAKIELLQNKNSDQFLNLTQESIEFTKEESENWKKTEIDFEYFFQTLNNHTEEKKLKLHQSLFDEESQSVSFQKRRKKSLIDREWRIFKKNVRKNDFESQYNIRRKSMRIQQIQDKFRLQTQMQELRSFYKSAQFRYNDLFVRLRVSYLKANLGKQKEYKIKRANIPEYSLEKAIFQDSAINKIIYNKRENLMRRFLRKE